MESNFDQILADIIGKIGCIDEFNFAMKNPHFGERLTGVIKDLATEYHCHEHMFARTPDWIIKGEHNSKEELVRVLIAKGHQFSDTAIAVINSELFNLIPIGEEYEVFSISGCELLGSDVVSTNINSIYKTRDWFGFCDTPFETALLIASKEKDDLIGGEWQYALSKPIVDDNGWHFLGVTPVSNDRCCIGGFNLRPDDRIRLTDNIKYLVCRRHYPDPPA